MKLLNVSYKITPHSVKVVLGHILIHMTLSPKSAQMHAPLSVFMKYVAGAT